MMWWKVRSSFLSAVTSADFFIVHRMLVLERKVLHRDMSRNNILMYPRHHSSTEPSSSTDSDFYTPEQPLRFIDEVLQKTRYVLNSMHRRTLLTLA